MSFSDNREHDVNEGNFDYEPSSKQEVEKAEHDHEVRKKIDDLLEKKRLKELLDDSEDW